MASMRSGGGGVGGGLGDEGEVLEERGLYDYIDEQGIDPWMETAKTTKKRVAGVIGTPIEFEEDADPNNPNKKKSEDAIKKYVPVWKQEVTDEKGRKRFHGAFTGGFSAGYFNTVGSKEGFTPATFKSSRSQKASQSTQRTAEDFMDEEDYTELVSGGKTLVAKVRKRSESV